MAQGYDDIMLRNQQESPLLRLPTEIRNQIYKYAIGGYKIHIRKSGKDNVNIRTFVSGLHRHGYFVVDEDLTALTRVCRQLQFEGAGLPLSLNVFVGFLWNVVKFLNRLNNTQLAQITAVHIRLKAPFGGGPIHTDGDVMTTDDHIEDDMDKAGQILRGMAGLRHVRVEWPSRWNYGTLHEEFEAFIQSKLHLAEHILLEMPTIEDIDR